MVQRHLVLTLAGLCVIGEVILGSILGPKAESSDSRR